MKIEILSKKTENLYKNFVNTQESITIHYSLKYRDLIIEETNSSPLYLIALEENNIKGILPLMVKNGPLGKVINSLPFYGSHGGIVSKDQKSILALKEYYFNLLKSNDYAAGVIIENPLIKSIDYEEFGTNETDNRICQISNIDGNFLDLEDLIKKFHSKTRNTIRKSVKSNVLISVENDQWDFLFSTHLENMNLIGGTPKKKQFFEKLKSKFEINKEYDIYTARHNGKIISALLVLYYGDFVEYFTPVTLSDYKNLQPMSLLIANCMLDSSRKGFKFWNWGGTWLSQDGVYKFKSRWGTENYNYKYHICVVNNEIYSSSKSFLLDNYYGFYIVPFNKLKN